MKRIITLVYAVCLLALPFGPASTQESYRIKSGDVLRIEVLEDSSVNRTMLVLPDGNVTLPMAGSAKARGLTVSQARAKFKQKLLPFYDAGVDLTVHVSLSQLAPKSPAKPVVAAEEPTIDVYVLGQVNNPGKVEVAEGTTVLQLLAEIGGFSQFAAHKRIQLRRVDSDGRERVYNVNYKDILAGKSKSGMTIMAPGDVIIVPERKLFE